MVPNLSALQYIAVHFSMLASRYPGGACGAHVAVQNTCSLLSSARACTLVNSNDVACFVDDGDVMKCKIEDTQMLMLKLRRIDTSFTTVVVLARGKLLTTLRYAVNVQLPGSYMAGRWGARADNPGVVHMPIHLL